MEQAGYRDTSHYVRNPNYSLYDDRFEPDDGSGQVQYTADPLVPPPSLTRTFSNRSWREEFSTSHNGTTGYPFDTRSHRRSMLSPPPRSVPDSEAPPPDVHAIDESFGNHSDTDDSSKSDDEFAMFGDAAVEPDYADVDNEKALWLAKKAREEVERGLTVINPMAASASRTSPGGIPVGYYRRLDSRRRTRGLNGTGSNATR
jgi:hypothetical protein